MYIWRQSFTSLFLLMFCLIGLVACQSFDTKHSSDNTNSIKAVAMNQAPTAEKIPVTLSSHGHQRIDDYFWLRDDKRTDPKVLNYLSAENEFLLQQMKHTDALQQSLFEELKGRVEPEDSSVPTLDKGYWYHYEFKDGAEYPIHYRRRDNQGSKPEVLLDENQLAAEHDFFDLADIAVSPDNTLLAYSQDTVSRGIYTIFVKEINTGKLLSDQIEGVSGSIVWANDSEHMFYIHKDPQTLLAYKVYRHKLGTSASDDVLVYEENDKSFFTEIGKTLDESLIAIIHESTESSGASILDANNPTGKFAPLLPRENKHEYYFEKRNNEIYLRTNKHAKNFRLVKATMENIADESKWQEVITHRDDVFIEEFSLFNDYLVVSERHQGQIKIRVIALNKEGLKNENLNSEEAHYLDFYDPIYVAMVGNNPSMDTKELRLIYSSLTTPRTVYSIDLATLEKKELKQTRVLGGFQPENYQSERVSITVRDGVQVPVSIVYRKDLFRHDGTNPLYLYGYGAYGDTIDPYFTESRLSLLDRGFVMAVIHVRGGQLLGRDWYEQGRLKYKQNSFTDFIDATKGLVEQHYGHPDKVIAAGGSAGGLLMAAIANEAPELYLGMVAHVPFVDVVTTMLDESLPLTTNEYDEWGNPNNKDDYFTMLAYSPYDNVKKQDYPNMLVTTGLHDSQVQYFEPAKWVAKLRDYKTDNNKLVFYIDMESGHQGASGRFKHYKDIALEYAFILDLVGISK